MARTPGKSVFDREVAELRLVAALIAGYQSWASIAQSRVTDAAFLQEQWRLLVIDPVMAQAVLDGYKELASGYLAQVSMMFDVIDTLEAIGDYAASRGLTKRATRNLMRNALALDARKLELVPAELMTVGGPGAPTTIAKGLPFVERGMSHRNRLEQVARTLATGMEGWSARDRALATGDHLRWVTMQDDKVRPAHRHAQGQTVPPDEPFMVGGFPMMFPGDPAAPEDLTINCRCVLASITPDRNRRYVQRYVPRDWLIAAGFQPSQVRAPTGTPIGGQWIDTPTAMLRGLNRLGVGVDVVTGPMGLMTPEQIAAERRRLADEVLAREGRPGVEETSQRVQDIYNRTTEEQRESGRNWYAEAREVAQGMVADSGGRLTEEQAAAVIAHLSTRTEWSLNVIAAQVLARGGTLADANSAIKAAAAAGTLARGGGILSQNWAKAEAASVHPDPIGRDNASLGTFSEAANKTRTFASNIMGDPDGVTIDTWMYRTLGQEPLLSGKIEGVNQAIRKDQVYESLAESVRDAADDLGVPPVDVQAATWMWTLDNYHPSRAGRPGYLLDPETGEEIPSVIGGPLVVTAGLAAIPDDGDPWIDDGEVLDYFYVQAAKLGITPLVDPVSSLDVDPVFTVVGWFDPASLTAAASYNPLQARAPRGTPIGGQWIDTPNAILRELGGWPGEDPDVPATPYQVPLVAPDVAIPRHGPEREALVEEEAARLDGEMPPPPPFDPSEVAAITAYTDGKVAAALNGALRKGVDDPMYSQMMQDLDAAIATGACPEDMYVYRLVPSRMLPNPGNMQDGLDDPTAIVGTVIADKGYLSTSIDPATGVASRAQDRVLVRIAVPTGHPVAWVKPFSQNAHENEVLLGRDTALAITAVTSDDAGGLVYDAVVAYTSVSASAVRPALTFAFNPMQARAPKGTSIGGQWIETPSAIAAMVQGPRSFEPAPANQIGGNRRVKYAEPLEDNSPQSALQANPHGDMINCQKCTTVYEMRRRGMDVVAAKGLGENLGGKKGLGDYFSAAEPVRLANEVPFRENPTDILRASNAYLSQYGPNSRGAIQVAFPRTGGGHVFNWEIDSVGDLHFLDAQIGRELTGKELTDVFGATDPYSIKFQRLDDARLGYPAASVVDQNITPLYDQPVQAEVAA